MTPTPTSTPTPTPTPTATSTPSANTELERVYNLHGGKGNFLRKRLLGNI
jgi:hypothetical protein